MLLDREFQVWLAVTKDEVRPALCHVHVVADPGADPGGDGYISGTAAATDGYILAVVPIKLAEGDQPGLVDPAVFAAAAKVAKKAKTADLTLDLSKPDLVGLSDGSWLPRWQDGSLTSPGTFPDWSPIVPARPTPASRENKPVLMAAILQPGLLLRVYKAIGCQPALEGPGSGSGHCAGRIVLGLAGKNGLLIEPAMVEPVNAVITAHFEPPYGLIMPMYKPAMAQDPKNYWKQETGCTSRSW